MLKLVLETSSLPATFDMFIHVAWHFSICQAGETSNTLPAISRVLPYELTPGKKQLKKKRKKKHKGKKKQANLPLRFMLSLFCGFCNQIASSQKLTGITRLPYLLMDNFQFKFVNLVLGLVLDLAYFTFRYSDKP